MGFASVWLEKNALFPAFISEAPEKNTGLIIVVPAYNEPDPGPLLDSLNDCTIPDCTIEVIIVVNAPADAPEEVVRNNRQCIKNIERWRKADNRHLFRLFSFNTGNHGMKDWGVGLARKTGMDEALRRFDAIENPEGAIVCLDADCTVRNNYLKEIYLNLVRNRAASACSIYFEHPLSGVNVSERIISYIIQYELHLRYYLQGLKYSEFPYAFHTVGSAMACKAGQYLKAGGMNRKQAGEDFYFIQKLVHQGGYFSLNSTTVYPSPRESFRVPFGTGATMTRMMVNNEKMLFTYNFSSFRDLSFLFRGAGNLYSLSGNELKGFYNNLSEGLRSFVREEEWMNKVSEIQRNTATVESFRKRFFGWFNMFRIVKYLNYVHSGFFEKQPVSEAASELLSIQGRDIKSMDTYQLLLIYRKMEVNIPLIT